MSWQTSSSVKVDHPFFRHSEKQTETPISGTATGTIPTWINGTLIRNGPGIQKVGETSYNHLFDGLAILHRFEIKNGQAFYQSRALESEAYKRNMAANRIVVSEFGTSSFPDPCLSILGKLQAKFESLMGRKRDEMEMTDNCSVNVAYYGDQLYAMTETVFIRRIDPETLKCIGDKTRIKNYCALNTATAHPHCLENGDILNVGNDFRHKQGPHYLFARVPKPENGSDETAYKNAEIIGKIPSRFKFNPTYFHSFGMTKNKIIFIESPLCLDILGMMTAPVLNNNYSDCLKWHSSEKTRFYIISMEDGKSSEVVYESDAFFTFHHINSYELNNCIVVDVVAYNDAEFIKNANIEGLNNKDYVQGATARRYVLPLSVEGAKPGDNLANVANCSATAKLRSGTTSVVDLTPHHLTKDWVELPRINYKYNGEKYNFVYALKSHEKVINYAFPNPTIITKINVNDGTTIDYDCKGKMGSEPIFISDPTKPDGDEDEGVVLTAVLHEDPTEVSLVVLNAKDMTELSKIKFKAEGTVTSTFHGLWQHANK